MDDPSAPDESDAAVREDLEELLREGRGKSRRATAVTAAIVLLVMWCLATLVFGDGIGLEDGELHAWWNNTKPNGQAMNLVGAAIMLIFVAALAWSRTPPGSSR